MISQQKGLTHRSVLFYFSLVLVTLGILLALALIIPEGHLLNHSSLKTAVQDELDLRFEFTKFISKYQKNDYNTIIKFKQGMLKFKENSDYIKKINKDQQDMKLGFNQFSDLSLEEFTKQFTGKMQLSDNQLNSLVTPDNTTNKTISNLVKQIPTPQPLRIGLSNTLTPVPKASTNSPTDIGIFDWRKFGKVSSVKDQNGCGSCYAFSSIAALESLLLMINPTKYSTVNLSEQQIVDCSSNFGNYGCNGGLEAYVFQYTKDFPVASEKQYPYKSKDQSCQTNSISNIGSLKTNSYVFKVRQTAAQLREAVKIQPISIGICAGKDLQFYESGIISSTCCRSNNHAVLLIGWGRQQGNYYWIMKNSYGKYWGEEGFFKVKMTENTTAQTCNIGADFTYPIIS